MGPVHIVVDHPDLDLPEPEGEAEVMIVDLATSRDILADHQEAARLRPGDPVYREAAVIGPLPRRTSGHARLA